MQGGGRRERGTQAFYDWNEVNIPDAAGRHRQIIPDGKLCSAGRDKYKGLDLPRTDWPATAMKAGPHTFRYRATAPHKGTFELYLTKDGYDPSKPLTWSDLEPEPFAKATDPALEDGGYVIEGTVPKRSGRQLVYSIWQRSDSPEAFYSCSDVAFGGEGGDGAGKAPKAPDAQQIAAGADKSTVDHGGHGGGDGGSGHGTEGGGGHGDGSAAPGSGPGGEGPARRRAGRRRAGGRGRRPGRDRCRQRYGPARRGRRRGSRDGGRGADRRRPPQGRLLGPAARLSVPVGYGAASPRAAGRAAPYARSRQRG